MFLGRTLYGLDAEIYLKIKAKEDPDWERKIGIYFTNKELVVIFKTLLIIINN